jgi:hypothetical protein
MKDSPWTLGQKNEAVKRGPHPSAQRNYMEFFRNEMADMCDKNYWMVLPYTAVRSLDGLRISPPGVVPQKDRRPRTIVDYTYSKDNENTVPLAPPHAMQFGRAPQRIVAKALLANPQYGPVKGILADMSDAFYRAQLCPDGVATLGVIVPSLHVTEDPLIAFPLTLPMGWKESPPWWCAISESITDIAQQRADNNWDPPLHRLEHMLPPDEISPIVRDVPFLKGPNKSPSLAYFDVFLDDFIALAQGDKKRSCQLRRILLHTMDEVIPPKIDCPNAKDPISIKKLLKGDGSWKDIQKILGWIMNFAKQELTLPPAKALRLEQLLHSISPTQKRISVRKWQKLLGELRSMVWAIPGGEGFFSRLQTCLKGYQKEKRISLSEETHAELSDWKYLSRSLSSRPTHFSELIPTYPHYIGSIDASGSGMGGVWFPPGEGPGEQPLLWRAPFHQKIVTELITDKNPMGTITNSDLELAGTVAHDDVLAQARPIKHWTTLINTDNKAAMYWRRKGSISSVSPASRLLRLAALHQRSYQYHPTHQYLSGIANRMADDASRLTHLPDSQFLSYFNFTYPQKDSWKLCHLRQDMNSALTCALLKQKPLKVSQTDVLRPNATLGSSGRNFVRPQDWTPGSVNATIPSPSSKCSTPGIEMDALPPVVDRSSLELRRMQFAMWGRRSPAWGSGILG